MTPHALRQALAAQQTPWPHDPLELLAAVEAIADGHPGDPTWTALLLSVNLQATVPTQLPPGLLRGDLVRFDGLSATWTARDTDGRGFLVRVPRPHLSAVERRQILRDGRALEPLVEGLVVREGCLVAPLSGRAIRGPLPESTAIRVVATTLLGLQRWAVNDFGPLVPGEEEWRETDGTARFVCLTPGPLRLAPWMRHAAFTLQPRGLLAPVLRGLVELPPTTAAEAAERLQKALIDDLSARAVDLRQRVLSSGHTRRRGRLEHVLERLGRALPPPVGDGPVGYDLEARPTRVSSDGTCVYWGPEAEPALLYDGTAFDAPVARRLLRALATAPAGGEPGFPEAMGRWVSAGLRIRTLRLLLAKTA
jgi:hypothetical protein